MAGADEHVSSRHVQFHRNAGRFRANRRDKNVRPDRALASKRAADERTNHAHIVERQIPGLRQNALDAFHKLRRVVKREFVVRFPGRDCA